MDNIIVVNVHAYEIETITDKFGLTYLIKYEYGDGTRCRALNVYDHPNFYDYKYIFTMDNKGFLILTKKRR